MGWHWDATRHKDKEVYILKNGTQKKAIVWKDREKWNFSDKLTGLPKTRAQIDLICLNKLQEARADAERIIYQRLGLKREQVHFDSSTTKTFNVLEHYMKDHP